MHLFSWKFLTLVGFKRSVTEKLVFCFCFPKDNSSDQQSLQWWNRDGRRESALPSVGLLLLHSGVPPLHGLISGWWVTDLDNFCPQFRQWLFFEWGYHPACLCPDHDRCEADFCPCPCSSMGAAFGLWTQMDLSLPLYEWLHAPLYRSRIRISPRKIHVFCFSFFQSHTVLGYRVLPAINEAALGDSFG